MDVGRVDAGGRCEQSAARPRLLCRGHTGVHAIQYSVIRRGHITEIFDLLEFKLNSNWLCTHDHHTSIRA